MLVQKLQGRRHFAIAKRFRHVRKTGVLFTVKLQQPNGCQVAKQIALNFPETLKNLSVEKILNEFQIKTF